VRTVKEKERSEEDNEKPLHDPCNACNFCIRVSSADRGYHALRRPDPIVVSGFSGRGAAVRLWQEGAFKLGRCAATVSYLEFNIIGALIIPVIQ
jgi:hypothetical protein